MNYQATDAVAGPSRTSDQSVQGWRSTTSSFASNSTHLDPMQAAKHPLNALTNSAPINSPLFDCVNVQTSANVTPQSTLSSSAGYFQPGPSNPTILRTKVEKDLPDLPPSEDDSISDFSGSHDTREDAYIDNSANFRQNQDRNHLTQSPVLSNVQDVQAVSSNGLFNRLSPSWSSAVKPRGKKDSLSGLRKPASRNGVSPGRGEDATLVGLGVDNGRLARVSNSSMADTTTSTSQGGDQGYNAWSNRAAAVKAAGQTAGVGLKKWGKASAAKIRQQTQQRQTSGREGGSPTMGSWGRVGTSNLTNFRRFDGRAAKSSADLPMTSSDGDQMNAYPSNASPSPNIQPDPRIGLPTDVRHNVHVDVGPQGYTGLPASWAQVLAQYGIDANEVRKDPAGAIALIRQRTQYYVDKEAELGQDPENTKRLLESRLGQLEDLQDARDAVRSVTPGPRANHHHRRSSDNATRSDATLRRTSNASTTYSSVLNQAWPPSPSWSDAPSLPQIPSQHISPSLPLVQADDSDEDWGASLLKSLPKSNSEEHRLYVKGKSDTRLETELPAEHADGNVEALADDLSEEERESIANEHRRYSFTETDQVENINEIDYSNAEDENGSIFTASRVPTSKVVRNPQLFAQYDQDVGNRGDSAPSEKSSRGTNETPSNARFASPEARDSSGTSHSIQSSLDDSYSFANDARSSNKTPAIIYGQSPSFPPSGVEAQPAGPGSRTSSSGERRRSSTQNEISKHVSEGLRERRKNAPRIYPPSSNKFVSQMDVPSPRSVGFKPALSVRTSDTSQKGGRGASLTTISNGSDASLSQAHSTGNHHVSPSPSQSPAISSKEFHSLFHGDENDTKPISKTMRNSGASVRLASQPLQMHFDQSDRRQGSFEVELDPPPALPYKQARVSPGQSTPDFIHPDADGFFRPSSSSALSAGHGSGFSHGNNTDRKVATKELSIPSIIGGDGLLTPEIRSQDGIGQSEEELSAKSFASKNSEPSTHRFSTGRRSDSVSTPPSGSNLGALDDYQPASDFLDDWLNDENDRDPSPGYGHSQSTGSDRAQSPFFDHHVTPQPSLPISLQTRKEPDAHQSPSPALLKGLPTPMRAQFNTSLQIPPQKDIDETNLSPLSQFNSLGRPIDEEKVARDWRVRSLPPPPPDEEDMRDMTNKEELRNVNKASIKMEKSFDQLSDDRLSVVSLPLHDFDSIDDASGPPKADSEAQELAALTRPGSRQSRPNSRQSRSSSRAGSRHLRRRSSDARRFPISMHYASGFDTDAFGADSEAISSFADLMRARQSMDLDDVMPMRLDSMMDVPPVPALPATLGKEQQTHVVDQESVNLPEIDPMCPSHLRSLVHPGNPQDLFENLMLIGEGESGDVFSAIPKDDCGIKSMEKSGVIAIKVVRMAKSHPNNSTEVGQDATKEVLSDDKESQSHPRLQNLDKELSLWRKADDHENVLTLFDVFINRRSNLTQEKERELSQLPGTIRDGIWIVQECMSMSLADVIALKMEGLDMNEHHMARIFGDISAALHHIHSKGIVHRDVRSDNILLTSDGKAKLTDFTHATSLSTNEKRSSVVGTTYWMAPEVIKAESYDQKADIWSLGAVLYELVEGNPPRVEFPALRAITLTVQLGLPPLQDPQKYSTALKECFAWCSELQPHNRPSADMILEGEFVACAASYEEMHTLMIEAQAMEAEGEGESNNTPDGEEEVLDERISRIESSGQHHARDSWTSQSTVQG